MWATIEMRNYCIRPCIWSGSELNMVYYFQDKLFFSQAEFEIEPWSSPDDVIFYPGWFNDPPCPLTLYFWNSTSLARAVARLKDKQLNSWNTEGGWGCQWDCFPLLESNGIEQRLALWGFMVMWYTMLPWNLPMHVLALSDSKEGVNGNYADLCPSLSYSALWVKSPRR